MNHGEILVGLSYSEDSLRNAGDSAVAVSKPATLFVLHILPPVIFPNYHVNGPLALGSAGSIAGLHLLAETLRMYLFT